MFAKEENENTEENKQADVLNSNRKPTVRRSMSIKNDQRTSFAKNSKVYALKEHDEERSSESILQDLIRELKKEYVNVNPHNRGLSSNAGSSRNVRPNEDKRRLAAKFNIFLSRGLSIGISDENAESPKKQNQKVNMPLMVPVREKRNETSIFSLLKLLPSFKLYLKYNMISDESLKEAIPFIRYKYVGKGNYVYDETNEDQNFFGLIKGEIAIKNRKKRINLPFLKKKTQNLNLNLRMLNIFGHDHKLEGIYEDFDNLGGEDKHKYEEILMNNIFQAVKANLGKVWLRKLNLEDFDKIEENAKILKNPGECFGEWNIINSKINKTSCALALENTHLFYMDKTDFMNTISRCVLRADSERKEFIKTCVKPFRNYLKFEVLYEKITTQFYEKGDYVFHENTKGRCFFIILQGGCVLQKFMPNSPEINYNHLSFELGNGKLIDVLKLERGGMVGLDCIYGINNLSKMTKTTYKKNNHSQSLYKYSLKVTEKSTVLFQINFDDINSTNGEEIFDFLFEFYRTQMKMVDQTCENYRNINEQMRPIYKKIKITRFENFKYDPMKVDNFMKKKIQNEIETRTRKNDFEVKKVKPSSKSCEIISDWGNNENNKERRESNVSSKKFGIKSKKTLSLNFRLKLKMNSKKNIPNVSVDQLASNRSDSKVTNSHLNIFSNFAPAKSYHLSTQAIPFINKDQIYIKENPIQSANLQTQSISQLEEFMRNTFRRGTVKRDSLLADEMKGKFSLKKSIDEPLNIKGTIQRSASDWKLVQSRNRPFKSGYFNIPLLSSILSKNGNVEEFY